MEGVKFSDYEWQVFNNLFSLCDVENTGQISGTGKVSELFLSSGLSQETLQQISTVCGARQQGHFARPQFFIALKLIAAAQNGLPVMIESLNSGRDLPLPKFAMQVPPEVAGGPNHPQAAQHLQNPGMQNAAAMHHQMQQHHQQQMLQHQQQLQQQQQQQHHLQQQQHLQQQILQQQKLQLQLQQQQQQMQQMQQQQKLPHQHSLPAQPHLQQGPPQVGNMAARGPGSPPAFSPVSSPPLSPLAKLPPGPPVPQAATVPAPVPAAVPQQYYPQPSAPPLPPQVPPVAAPPAVAPVVAPVPQPKEQWSATFENGTNDTQDLIEDGPGASESGGGESVPKDWAHFSTDSSGKEADTTSMSSETSSMDDIYAINDEQRRYYTDQFTTMQPDTADKIMGGVAKEFFEKSKLPYQELSKIWELSDYDKDGALTLDEFCTAMHLVVLRRNDIELPDTLPLSLMPAYEPFAYDLPPGSTLKRATPSSPVDGGWPGNTTSSSYVAVNTSSVVASSPTSSSISSPGGTTKPTPVNFEFRPIIADADSKIVHPVAMRMSPQGHAVAVDAASATDTRQCSVDSVGYDDLSPNDPMYQSPEFKQQQAQKEEGFTDDLVDLGPDSAPPPPPVHRPIPLQPRPRPTPLKQQHSVPGAGSDGIADRPGSLAVGDAPAPPPRPRGHSRSSSLDNTLADPSDSTTTITSSSSNRQVPPPPAVPPRPSPKDAPNATQAGAVSDEVFAEGGAVGVTKAQDDAMREKLKAGGEAAKKQLHQSIREQKMKNLALGRLNGELNQELQEVMEQRIALEIQLEHLKPFSY